jgi:hypothetical protein
MSVKHGLSHQFEKRVLKKIFWPEGEVTGEWGKLCNEELRDLYSKADIVVSVKSTSVILTCMGERRHTCEVLLRKPEVKRPLGRRICVCTCMHLHNIGSSLSILLNEQNDDS